MAKSTFLKYLDPFLKTYAFIRREHRNKLQDLSLCPSCKLVEYCQKRKDLTKANAEIGIVSVISVCPDFVECKAGGG